MPPPKGEKANISSVRSFVLSWNDISFPAHTTIDGRTTARDVAGCRTSLGSCREKKPKATLKEFWDSSWSVHLARKVLHRASEYWTDIGALLMHKKE